MLVGNRERAIAVLQNGSAAGKTPITALPAQAVRLLANCGPQWHAFNAAYQDEQATVHEQRLAEAA